MAVLVKFSARGFDQTIYDQMVPAIYSQRKKQPGFIIHVAYLTNGGFLVEEVWESKAQCLTWYNEFVKPNLPVPRAVTLEFIELYAISQP